MDRRAEPADAVVVKGILDDTIALYARVREMDPAPVIRAAAAIRDAFTAGGKLLVFGNGGSAADAQHLATELVGRFTRERQALAAIALTTDTSILTAVANDYGFDRVFVRQIEALGRPGDVAFGISTSGKSPSVLKALDAARARGLTTVALTGYDGGPIGATAQIHINVPASSTPRVQEVHGTLIHAICELVERTLMTD
jgi:D-sedoheptulose 7-phosphate isomerase